MNAYQLMAAQQQAGLGFTSISNGGYGGGSIFDGSGGGGGWYQNWGGSLINQAGNILTGIFGNRNGGQSDALLQQQLLQQQYLAQQQAAGVAPGSQVASGLSGAWSNIAGTLGVSPGTLTMVALAGGVLLFMSPPSRRR